VKNKLNNFKNLELLVPAGLTSPELLAPAGDLGKMKVAFEFGADAVYFGLPDFSLRARINKFDKKTIEEAAKYCREKNKKFYMTFNIYAHNVHLEKLPEQLKFIKEIKPDALIISDPGIFNIVKKEIPEMEIHLSTQANVTNYESARFWFEQGVKRIILAREVGLDEIKEIKEKIPELELEYFVHGAMCMSYSGRCILSKWMTNRSANLGDCAQPCRWKYHTKNKDDIKTISVIDDQDRFEMDIEEDQNGTHFFNSYDLNLIEYLEDLVKVGVSSFKIEGRAKSVYYVAIVSRAYRKVLDAIIGVENKTEIIKIIKSQKKELDKLSNRGYWTGFLLNDEPPHLFDKAAIIASDLFIGISFEDKFSKQRKVFVHNHFNLGDKIDVIISEGNLSTKILKIVLPNEGEKKSAHGGLGRIYEIDFDLKIKGVFLMRKVVKTNKA